MQNRDHLKIGEYAFWESRHLVFSKEVRDLCEKNACGMYGKSWACPPGVGSIVQCEDQCSAFQRVFVFNSLGQLRKKHDVMDGMRRE
jgi:predicted metal-binding protein